MESGSCPSRFLVNFPSIVIEKSTGWTDAWRVTSPEPVLRPHALRSVYYGSSEVGRVTLDTMGNLKKNPPLYSPEHEGLDVARRSSWTSAAHYDRCDSVSRLFNWKFFFFSSSSVQLSRKLLNEAFKVA